MTAAEFAEAKEIIIDLLGWNVPVDYLIHCGLTREVIYYVFTELNLRYVVLKFPSVQLKFWG